MRDAPYLSVTANVIKIIANMMKLIYTIGIAPAVILGGGVVKPAIMELLPIGNISLAIEDKLELTEKSYSGVSICILKTFI